MNTFGEIFRLTTFGESHGPAIGGVIDGMPAGISIDLGVVQHELDRRRPGQSALTTPRKESDRVEILSGLFEGKTTGTPIGFIIRNENQITTICATCFAPRTPTIPIIISMAYATTGAADVPRHAKRRHAAWRGLLLRLPCKHKASA